MLAVLQAGLHVLGRSGFEIDSGCGLVFRFECATFVTVTDHDFDLSLLPLLPPRRVHFRGRPTPIPSSGSRELVSE